MPAEEAVIQLPPPVSQFENGHLNNDSFDVRTLVLPVIDSAVLLR